MVLLTKLNLTKEIIVPGARAIDYTSIGFFGYYYGCSISYFLAFIFFFVGLDYQIQILKLKREKERKMCILALKVSKISAFIRTDRQTNMARSTKLVILIKNIGIDFIRSL